MTQLFYLVNAFHDHLQRTAIGFVDGGFRTNHGQPRGEPDLAESGESDPVLAQALDGADTGPGPGRVADGPTATTATTRTSSRSPTAIPG